MSYDSGLSELYQEVILDHSRSPRNSGRLDGSSHQSVGFNPLCGDQIALFLQVSGNKIEDVRFEAVGCAISLASASLMSEAIKGKTVEEAEKLFESFHEMLTEDASPEQIGKLAALAGTREFPMRVKCATLAWHTLTSALKGDCKTISTEEDA